MKWNTGWRRGVRLAGALVFLGVGMSCSGEDTGATVWSEKAKTSALAAADRVRKGLVARDLAIKSVENAMAAVDDSEIVLLDVLKTGKATAIDNARAGLKRAMAEAMEAAETAGSAVERVADAGCAADAAGEQAKLAAQSGVKPSVAARAAKLSESFARETAKQCAKADALAETLKDKWLIPQKVGACAPQPPNVRPPPAATDNLPANATSAERR
jgi:hypothetical protein